MTKTTQHDFKGALKWNDQQIETARELGIKNVPEYKAIRFALLLADKITQKPSEDMIAAAWKADGTECGQYLYGCFDAFKAMIDQTIKEIE